MPDYEDTLPADELQARKEYTLSIKGKEEEVKEE